MEIDAILVGADIVAREIIAPEITAGVAPKIATVRAVFAVHVVGVGPRVLLWWEAAVGDGGGRSGAWGEERAVSAVDERLGEGVGEVEVARDRLGEGFELLKGNTAGGEGGEGCGRRRGGGWAWGGRRE